MPPGTHDLANKVENVHNGITSLLGMRGMPLSSLESGERQFVEAYRLTNVHENFNGTYPPLGTCAVTVRE